MDPELLSCEGVMKALLYCHDAMERRQAEQTVARALRDESSAVVFVGLIHLSGDPGVRQLSAVLIRKKISGWVSRLSDDKAVRIKAGLIEALVNENQRLVRLAIAHAISTLAKSLLRANKWPELLPTLQGMARGSDAVAQEAALLIFYNLCETIVEGFGTATLVNEVAMPSLEHPSTDVNLAGMKVVQTLIAALEERNETTNITRMLPPIIRVLEKVSVLPNSCETCVGVLEVLEGVFSLPIKKHRDTITRIAMSLISLIQEARVHNNVRHQAMLCLTTLLENKPKFVQNSEFIGDIVRACAQLFCEDESVCAPQVYDTEDFDDDVDSTTPSDIAAFLMDSVCTNIHPRVVMETLLSNATRLFNSASPLEKKGALLFTAVPCREYAEALRPHTELLMRTATECGQMGGCLREAALVALAFHVQYLQPEAIKFHGQIIPLLLGTLKEDATPNIRHKVCLTLDTYTDNLGEEVHPYVPDIVNAMLYVLHSPQSTVMTQHAAISCLSSVLETRMANDFVPQILPVLEKALDFTDAEMMALRAEAVEALSVLAIAAGEEMWRPIFPRIFAKVQAGMEFDFAQLREQTYGFYANMAELLRGDFVQFLGGCLPNILRTIQDDKDGEIRDMNPLASNMKTNIQGDSESDTDSDVSDDADLRMRVHHTVVDEKCAAVYTIGIFAEKLGPNFAQHVPECVLALRNVEFYFDEMVRKNVIIAATQLTLCIHRANFVPREVGLPRCDTLHPNTREYVDNLNLAILSILRSDVSVTPVSGALDAIKLLCDSVGSVAVHMHIDDHIAEMKNLLAGTGFCQVKVGDDEADELQTRDLVLFDSIGEALEGLARCYGPAFFPFLEGLMPALWEYGSPSQHPESIITALAVMTSFVYALNEAITPFCEQFVKRSMEYMTDQNADTGVTRNAVVLFGALAEVFNCSQHFGAAQDALARLIINCPDETVIDNCISSMIKMLRVANAPEPPAHRVVDLIISHLPLKQDMDENETVYGGLVWVVEKYGGSDAARVCLVPLCRALAHPKVQENVKGQIASSLQRVDRAVIGSLSLEDHVRDAMKRFIF
eukprot:PhM_4_TR6669/c0_g1_i1/m.28627/K20221/IPO4, RANBP4; importin-4